MAKKKRQYGAASDLQLKSSTAANLRSMRAAAARGMRLLNLGRCREALKDLGYAQTAEGRYLEARLFTDRTGGAPTLRLTRPVFALQQAIERKCFRPGLR